MSMTVIPDPAALATALDSALPRVIANARSGGDANAKVPGLSWTAAEVGTHLVMALLAFAAAIRGDESDYGFGEKSAMQTMPEYLSTANDSTLEMLGPKTLEEVAQGLEAAHLELREIFAKDLDLETEVPAYWYGPGQTRTVGTLLALAVTETLVHGWDLAGALGLDKWFPASEALPAFPTVMTQMLPLLVDPNFRARRQITFEIRITGAEPFTLSVLDGKAWAGPARAPEGEAPDCVIEMDPAWGLLVGFRRVSIYRALLRGKSKASGRKPWLGMKFQSCFMSA
ncbi:MAG TPA: maleylpyruvate isomerase N-terminal domain-containing protein [Aeromicrobium sp.]|nr:maleylpyruvate isomerase N-terminal domain-containing protein [Aeromicrobium sp.]